MNQRWRVLALWLLPVAVVAFLGVQVLRSGNLGPNGPTTAPRNTAVARMSYGRFLDYVQAGRVTAVDIYDGGRNAVIEVVDPDLDNRVQRLRVDLPGLAPELVNNLKEQGISFDIHPPRQTPPALGILGNLLFPLLLIGSLIFLARRGSGMPGGPGQAMQFGKTKARFAMEAETGVMFNDVAGVEEAKQDLQEVVTFLKTPERSRHRQDPSGQGDRRRSRGALLLPLRLGVRGDVRGRGCQPGARPVQAGQGEQPLPDLHR